MQVGFTMMAQPCVKDKRTLTEHIGCTKLQVPGRSDQQVFTYFVFVRLSAAQPPLHAAHVQMPFGGGRQNSAPLHVHLSHADIFPA